MQKGTEMRSLTDINKDILSMFIDCVEHQYPIYPHVAEPLKKELDKALKDSDIFYVECTTTSSLSFIPVPVLKQLKEICSEQYLEDILCYLSETSNSELKIVNDLSISKRIVNRQAEPESEFKYIYIWQATGVCGDDYRGEIFIPLPDNTFLYYFYFC